MNKSLHREQHGPGWGEVILGALLSLLIGIALAMVHLFMSPVTRVRETPKEPQPGQVYFVEGSATTARAREAGSKKKAFLEGHSVVLSEDELNAIGAAFVANPVKTSPGKTPPKSEGGAIAAGTPNFRIRDSILQIAVPLWVEAFGVRREIVLQTRGGFTREGTTFVFTPTETYVGSCPVDRLPGVTSMILKRLFAEADIPDELPAAWHALTDVALDGSTLRLTVQ